ncbi:uncharacterized protein K02A2.6-like [Anopheles arabiensis]|uniref:uncharacterized protein K02A2.6-like n=1 Tax=Anopheles arabiensis TaxID=7173 RepID=UPI001AAD5928|nr:uncharacterized protein K02A2.6-like [Anopheles arabiensis]
MIVGEKGEQVYAIQNGDRQNKPNFRAKESRPRWGNHDGRSGNDKPSNPCWLCGELHCLKDCPQATQKCRVCNKAGHRENRCRNRKGIRRGRNQFFSTNTVRMCSVQTNRKFVNVSINGTVILLQLDTASDITVIDETAWRKLGQPSLVKPSVNAKTASNEELKLLGEFSSTVSINNVTKPAIIRVAPGELLLLGADLVDLFELASVPMNTFCATISTHTHIPQNLQKSFSEVFNGTGLCTKAQIRLQLKENSRPVFRPKRPVAYAMQAVVDGELERLEKAKIITPVDYSDWAAPIVVVRKSNGNVRICGDYSTGLNDALQPHEYPLPLPDDIFAKLAHCQYFSKIDLSDAFSQVEIEECYRPLLTINTHRGLYHYNRLPPGIKIAPAGFNKSSTRCSPVCTIRQVTWTT